MPISLAQDLLKKVARPQQKAEGKGAGPADFLLDNLVDPLQGAAAPAATQNGGAPQPETTQAPNAPRGGLSGFIGSAKKTVQGVAQKASGAVTSGQAVVDQVAGAAGGALDSGQAAANGAADQIDATVNAGEAKANELAGQANDAVDSGEAAVGGAATKVLGTVDSGEAAVNDAAGKINGGVDKGTEALGKVSKFLPGKLGGFLGNAATTVKSTVSKGQAATGNAAGQVRGAVGKGQAAAGNAATTARGTVASGKTAVGNAAGTARTAVADGREGVGNAVGTARGGIDNAHGAIDGAADQVKGVLDKVAGPATKAAKTPAAAIPKTVGGGAAAKTAPAVVAPAKAPNILPAAPAAAVPRIAAPKPAAPTVVAPKPAAPTVVAPKAAAPTVVAPKAAAPAPKDRTAEIAATITEDNAGGLADRMGGNLGEARKVAAYMAAQKAKQTAPSAAAPAATEAPAVVAPKPAAPAVVAPKPEAAPRNRTAEIAATITEDNAGGLADRMGGNLGEARKVAAYMAAQKAKQTAPSAVAPAATEAPAVVAPKPAAPTVAPKPAAPTVAPKPDAAPAAAGGAQAPAAPKLGKAAPVAKPTSGSVDGKLKNVVHVVEKGDTLWDIALKYLGSGTRWNEIYAINSGVIGPDPNLILPGQRIRIPTVSKNKQDPQNAKPQAANTHCVVKGDTLWAISQKYLGDGRRWDEIFKANASIIKDPNLIYPGQVFKIPSGAKPTDKNNKPVDDGAAAVPPQQIRPIQQEPADAARGKKPPKEDRGKVAADPANEQISKKKAIKDKNEREKKQAAGGGSDPNPSLISLILGEKDAPIGSKREKNPYKHPELRADEADAYEYIGVPEVDPLEKLPAAKGLTFSSTGDPHEVSGDGKKFDNMGIGYYTALKTAAGDFEVTKRHEAVAGLGAVGSTVNTEAAIKVGPDVVKYYAKNDQLLINDDSTTLKDGEMKTLPGKGTVLKKGNKITTTSSRGDVVTLTDQGKYLDINGQISETRKDGEVTGSLGRFDADTDASNDLVKPDGKMAANVAEFIKSWETPESQNLLLNPAIKATPVLTKGAEAIKTKKAELKKTKGKSKAKAQPKSKGKQRRR